MTTRYDVAFDLLKSAVKTIEEKNLLKKAQLDQIERSIVQTLDTLESQEATEE